MQKWKTKSGKKSSITGERYLPEKAIKALSSFEYRLTTKAKRKAMKIGKQFSKQPKYIADLPPSTPIICPVIQELSSDSKNFASDARSLPSPNLLRGCCLAIPSAIFGFFKILLAILELLKLGAIQFILTLGAISEAKDTVSPSREALTGEIIL